MKLGVTVLHFITGDYLNVQLGLAKDRSLFFVSL
jgi:hypothetical protein